MLEQTVTEMQEDLIKMRQASAQVMASQKQLEAKYNQAQQTADDWYRRAQLALQKVCAEAPRCSSGAERPLREYTLSTRGASSVIGG